MRTIMGIEVGNREDSALNVQKVLTESGCIIKTRLGLHEAVNICSSKGLILLEFVQDKEKEVKEFEEKISKIEDVKVQKMEF